MVSDHSWPGRHEVIQALFFSELGSRDSVRLPRRIFIDKEFVKGFTFIRFTLIQGLILRANRAEF